MSVPSDKLKQLVAAMLSPAKANLEQYGEVAPTVLIFRNGVLQKTIPVADKFQVGKTIKRENPESFVYVSEAWQKDFSSEEERLGSQEVLKRMNEGRILAPSESPNRRELILLIGGTGTLRISLEQRFHRNRQKILYDGTPEMREVKLGDSLVDWEDQAFYNPSRLLTTAPVGGRIMHFEPNLDIWIPEGWKMDWEPNDSDPNRKPVWHRANNPNGALRLGVETHTGPPDKPWNPNERARQEADMRSKDGVTENIQLAESKGRPLLTFSFQVKDRRLDQPWTMRVFKVFDTKGAILLRWTSETGIKESILEEELAAVREIVNRFVRY